MWNSMSVLHLHMVVLTAIACWICMYFVTPVSMLHPLQHDDGQDFVPSQLMQQLKSLKQQRLLDYLTSSSTSISDTRALVRQLSAVDLTSVLQHHQQGFAKGPSPHHEEATYSSLQTEKVADTSASRRVLWNNLGADEIAANKVAVLTLAGGQGSRLGFSGPKGAFPITKSKKTLFELFAHRIRKTQHLSQTHTLQTNGKLPAGRIKILWFIMTSPINDGATRDLFTANSYFGLDKTQVIFFQQSLFPTVDAHGKLILETKQQVSVAPSGNGEVYAALKSSGALATMRQAGVTFVHIHAVDNAIAKVPDALAVGYAISTDSDVVNKVVRKKTSSESIGVFMNRSGSVRVLEYTDLPPSLASKLDDHGNLVYGSGNICNHIVSLGFLEKASNLAREYHHAFKKVRYFDHSSQTTVKSGTPNAYKLESFIFDAFSVAKRVTLLEVEREREFAPVKNADGEDSPDSARLLLSNEVQQWLVNAGANVSPTAAVTIEVSPLVSLNGEGLNWFSGSNLIALDTMIPPSVGFGAPFDVNKLSVKTSGTHEQQRDGSSFRVHYFYDGQTISPWHNIPLLRHVHPDGSLNLNFICEVPRGSVRKFEIHKSDPWNIIRQDVKCNEGICKLRNYSYPLGNPASPCNYGAFPQTWEDPHEIDEELKLGGDNDPIDVLHIEDKPCDVGEVISVKVLGALAMLDDGKEVDWKIIVVNADNNNYDSLESGASSQTGASALDSKRVPLEKIGDLIDWFRMYKTAEGKQQNTFGFNDKPVGRTRAVQAIFSTHELWQQLNKRECVFETWNASSGQANVAPCWSPETVLRL
eukprot:m.224750 g.224750  ORF g.224750 m.224750 type:complete len:813 (-) comp33441_c0_seq4:93-2531(-)